ncbi:MAG TPA: ParB/RepB/Spo0J family partition protein [Candidatus Sulfotelmatobacter sp.]|nr:ParB/RepB/Spo0J family partition protein [Candidatus Sulfotelmatobacter sp.]
MKKKTRGPKTQARKTQVRMTQVRKFTVEDLKGTVRMNTTATAGNVAEKDKDKVVEKRRALGRGLAALFSGPRVVAAPGTSSPGGGLRPDLGAAVVQAETAELRSAGQPEAAVPTSAAPSSAEEQQIPHAVEVESTEPVPVHTDAVASIDGSSAGLASGAVEYDAYEERAPGETIEIQAVADTRIPANLVVNVPIADIDKNPFQTRYVEDDEALEELAESIKANGVVQPIVVRPADVEGRYILVMGERRLHASKKAGKTHIPALVRRVSEQQAAEMTIIENLQREDLSPLEQAEAFRVLSNEFKLTQEEIGQRVGLSRVSVANYMRLLKLPREVMQMLAEKRLNFAQAKELLKLEGNDRIAEAALYAVKKGMNIEQIEMLVLRMDGLLDPLPDMPGVKKKEAKASGARWVDPNVRAAQMDLERMLGVRVRIRDRKGHGKIVIEYSTVDDYDRVVEMLRGRK